MDVNARRNQSVLSIGKTLFSYVIMKTKYFSFFLLNSSFIHKIHLFTLDSIVLA